MDNAEERQTPQGPAKSIDEKPWKPKTRPTTFGYDPVKDKELIDDLSKWYTCLFCGLQSEIRPHAPLGNDEWRTWKAWPIRLCFYCAQIQEAVRERIKSYDLQDGN